MEETKIEKPCATLVKISQVKRMISPGKFYDSLFIFYRDAIDNKKKYKFIDRAQIPYYIIKDKESPEAFAPPMFIEADKVEKNIVFSDLLYREISQRTGTDEYFSRILLTKGENSSGMKNLLKHNWVYNADMDISDRYISYFYEKFNDDMKYKLHKCYFDIEVDLMENGFVKDSNGRIGYQGFPDEEEAPCPVSIITLIDDKSLMIYVFVLINHKNDSQREFMKRDKEVASEVLKEIENDDNTKFNDIQILYYENEFELITGFFNKVHEIDPDFIAAWNSPFDILTLTNRLKKICVKMNEDPLRYICDSKLFNQKNSYGDDIEIEGKAYFKIDKTTPIVDRTDFFNNLDGINWVDQMSLYAAIRKTSGLKESYALNAIAEEELGKEKLDYTGYTLKNLAWKNYEKFFKYNIKDSLLLKLLEDKNMDFDMLQKLSEITNTRKEKVFKKTISLKNYIAEFATENNYVISNNKNAKYGDEEDQFLFKENYLNNSKIIETDENYKALLETKDNYGAYVANPLLNNNVGTEILGKKSNRIFRNVGDQDFSSLYPSIIQALNLDANALVGKFFLYDPELKSKLISKYGYNGLFEASKKNQKESSETSEDVDDVISDDGGTNDLAPTFIDSLESQDWESIGEKYFDLSNSSELIEKIKNLKSKKETE